jgi:hypothetical protein
LFIPLAARIQPQPPPPVSIVWSALEVHTDPERKTAVVVFRARDQAQRSELAVLVGNHSGEMVELQGATGKWQSARMFRLRTYLGRGLLLVPTPSPIAERSQFLLRVPGGSAAPPCEPGNHAAAY